MEKLISQYKKIWDDYQFTDVNANKLLDRKIAFQYDENESDCDLIFIGMNPSYKTDYQDHNVWKREDVSEKGYFLPFIKIAEELKVAYEWEGDWTHFDLFAFRETKQSFIKNNLMKSEVGRAFLNAQLEVAKERLLRLRPKVIVFNNAFIKEFLGINRSIDKKTGKEVGVWLGDWIKFKFNREIGTYVIIEPQELKGVPVFFSSMLSGQRALDLGSRERLVWHIAEVMKTK